MDAFGRTIAATVIKVLRRFDTADPDAVDEMIQEVYLRLCADDYRLFRESHASLPAELFGLVQAVATTTTLDSYRNSHAKKRGGDIHHVALEALAADCPPAASASEQMDREVLVGQIDRRLEQILTHYSDPRAAERDRYVFWLYYRHGFTAKEIAAMPMFGLTDKGVESALYRLTSMLREIFGASALSAEGEKA